MTTQPLRRVFTIVNGGTPTPDDENWDGEIAWATPIDIGRMNGSYINSTQRTLTARGLRTGSSLVPSGSLIVSTRAPIGYVTETTIPMAFNQGCRGLVPRDDIDARYFRYQLLVAAERLQVLGQGSTFVELTTDALAAFSLVVPRLAQQRSIADYLDTETARIDAAVRVRVEQEALLDERESALVSHKLVPPGCPTSRLRYMASIQSGLTVDAQRDPGPHAVTRPYLRVANVHADELVLDSVTEITVPRDLADRCTLRFGDVLMTEGGDLDKLGRGTMWRDQLPGALHQNHVFAVRPVPHVLDPEFLALLTRTMHARAYFERTGSKTTGLASTSSEKILNLPVPALSLDAQHRLVREVTAEIDRMRQLRSSLRRQTELLNERRQALVTAAVTGQLDLPGVAA